MINASVTAERYLDKRKELALVILLVDARRLPSDDDRAVMEALYENGRPICVVATKADKIMSSSTDDIELNKNLIAIQKGLGLPEGQPLTVSSVSGLGIRDLWRIIIDTCEDHVAELKSKAEQGASFFEQEDATNNEWQEDTLVDDESMVYSQGVFIFSFRSLYSKIQLTLFRSINLACFVDKYEFNNRI